MEPIKICPYNHLDKLCDAIIVASDGTEFKAHKLFLTVRSGYFRSYFRGNIEKKERLNLPYGKDLLENILIFIYTGKVCFNDENIASLIIAADYLLIEDLLARCKDFALREISIENCVSLITTSYIVERLEITSHCFRFLHMNFGSLCHDNSGIEELPYSTLKSLLHDDSLGVADEETVWKAIEIWVTKGEDERLKQVSELLSCIRWNYLRYNFALCIFEHPIVRENIFCNSKDFKKFVTFAELQSGTLQSSPERCPSKMHFFIHRNTSSGDKSEIYLTYDGKFDMWRKIGDTDGHFDALFTIGRFIYIFQSLTDKMKTFDLLQKTWVERGNTRSDRYDHCVVQGQNGLFAVGGIYDRYMLNTTFEYYNPMEDSWTLCKPEPLMRVSGAIVINGKLYVIGHHSPNNSLEMRVIAYDLTSDTWTDIEVPHIFRINFGIINFRDQIHLFGGENENQRQITSVETFNISKNEWKEFPSLPFPYMRPRPIIWQGKLMVYDNFLDEYLFGRTRFSPCVWNDEFQRWDVQDTASPFSEIHRYMMCCIEDWGILRELFQENKLSATLFTKSPFAIQC